MIKDIIEEDGRYIKELLEEIRRLNNIINEIDKFCRNRGYLEDWDIIDLIVDLKEGK